MPILFGTSFSLRSARRNSFFDRFMMSRFSTLRIVRQVLFAGTVAVSTAGFLNAQTSGGDFGAVAQQDFSGQTNSSNATSRSQFNSIPFRAVNKQPNDSSPRPPIRLNSPIQVANRSSLRSGKVPAKTVGFSPMSQPDINSHPNSHPQGEFEGTQEDSSSAMSKFVELSGTVYFIDDIMLPAREAGVIKSLSVKEGDSIPAGKVVGQIDDELAQRILEQNKLRLEMANDAADDTTGIRAAEMKYKVARIEADKTTRLSKWGSKSDSERMMAVYTKDIAKLEWEKAIEQSQIALGEKKLAEAQFLEAQTRIKHHVLQSDFDAFVVKILKKPQEYVQPGEEVMRIARMDRLWVQGTVDVKDLNPHEVINRPVTITVKLARNQTTTFAGRITNVGLERQGLTRYMVKAEVQNRPVGGHWVLQPLGEVTMKIHLDGNQAQAIAPQLKR